MLRGMRKKIRNTPHLGDRLLEYWAWLHHQLWKARNILTLRRPIPYSAGNQKVSLNPEGQIAEALWYGFESAERDFVSSYLSRNMQVVNAGANIGLYSIMASALVGPKGKVHAFEPSTQSYIRLLKNLALNGCHNCIANKLGLSNVTESLVLRVDPKSPRLDGHRFVEKLDAVHELQKTDEVVECVTLDSYLTWRGIRSVDFMVIDIEGAELGMLEGSVEILTHSDPTLVLECNKNQEEVERFLSALGYRFWVWDGLERALQPCDFMKASLAGDIIVRREGWGLGK
jgi:FkbM family methyltransferase